MVFLQEFREFAIRGSVIDLAVGVIIGAAFQKIVDSAVGDVMMPALGRITGGMDFKDLYFPLAGQEYGLPLARAQQGGAVIAYGQFFNVLIQFLIMAFAVFLIVKAVNRLREAQPGFAPPAPEPTSEEKVLVEIRDLLKARS
jgi:large conductance mechanosensitive channel